VPAHSWSSPRLACGGARRLEALLSATSTAWLDGFIETARPAIAARHRWPWAKAIVGALVGAPESRRFDGRRSDRERCAGRDARAIVRTPAVARSRPGEGRARPAVRYGRRQRNLDGAVVGRPVLNAVVRRSRVGKRVSPRRGPAQGRAERVRYKCSVMTLPSDKLSRLSPLRCRPPGSAFASMRVPQGVLQAFPARQGGPLFSWRRWSVFRPALTPRPDARDEPNSVAERASRGRPEPSHPEQTRWRGGPAGSPRRGACESAF
jgi:hypothetical protein